MEPHGQVGATAMGEFGEIDDPELARAIEASYRAQTNEGLHASEDEQLAEALRLSQLEEQDRQRGTTNVGTYAPPVDLGFPRVPHTLPEPVSVPPNRRPPADRIDDGFPDDYLRTDVHRPNPGLGEALMPGVMGDMDAETMRAAAIAEQADMSERELALAIEASYNAQTEEGRMMNDDSLLEQALRMSKNEEDARQRANLRETQEQELQESMLMDQMREQEEKRRRLEEQQKQRLEADSQQEEVRRQEARKQNEELKRAQLPEEPPAGEEGRVDVMVRLPDGKRLRRAFRATNKVGQVYDYIDVEGGEAVAALDGSYRLVTTMPRQAYEDRTCTLAEVGLKGQCAMLVESMRSGITVPTKYVADFGRA